jgi:hypothetical protein
MSRSITVITCAHFAKMAYALAHSPQVETIEEVDWEPICNYNIKRGRNQVVIRGWRCDDTAVIAVKGTSPTNLGDIASDEQLAIGLRPSQLGPAIAVSALSRLYAENVVFTGHSLGGHLAQSLAQHSSASNCRYVTFNAPGINTRVITQSGVNIYVKWDLVRLAGGRHYGPTYKIESRFQDFLSAHKMDNVLAKLQVDPIGALSIDDAIRRATIFS